MASRLTTFIIVLIVTGTLVAGLIVGAQREDENGPVDLIITNGQVFTGAGGALAQAVAVRGNKILKVGTNRDVKRLRRRQTVSIDAHGATVLAGFNDSHAHLILGGLGLKQLDLLNARTLDAIKDTCASMPLRMRTGPGSSVAAGTTNHSGRRFRRGCCSTRSCRIDPRSSPLTMDTRDGRTHARSRRPALRAGRRTRSAAGS